MYTVELGTLIVAKKLLDLFVKKNILNLFYTFSKLKNNADF